MGENYQSADDMWVSAVETCLATGRPQESRHGRCLEVIGWSATLCDVDRAWVCNPVRALSPAYACAEYLHTVARDDGLEMIAEYAPGYGKYADPDDPTKIKWAYGYRMGSQLECVIDLLKEDPDSRAAVVQVWERKDLVDAQKRTGKKGFAPCTLSWQFLARDGKVHMVATIRSQDAWLGMPNDIFVATMLQRIVAGELGLALGTCRHNVGSLHVYDKYRDRCLQALSADSPSTSRPLQMAPTTLAAAQRAVENEALMRSREPYEYTEQDKTHRCVIAAVGSRWNVHVPQKSPALYKE